MLAEVGQVVDQVLIINHGKLVVESSLEELTLRVGGFVRIHTPEPAKLEEALRRQQVESAASEHGLLVHGVTTEQLGDIAFAAGVPGARAGRGRLVIESVLFAFVPSVGRLAPVHAENGLMGLTDAHTLHAAAGVVLAARRDVN